MFKNNRLCINLWLFFADESEIGLRPVIDCLTRGENGLLIAPVVL